MAYNERLAERIRLALSGVRNVQEKKMFGGIAFLVNGKMCVGVDKQEMMVRCDPEMTDKLLTRKGVRVFDLTGRPMRGWLLVGGDEALGKKDLERWIGIAMDANKKANRTKKKIR